jgi:hypothetical protein
MSKRETNDARKLRAVAAALRDWGRKAGPPGRDSSTVPDEEREAARQALGLAVKNLDIITQARDRYGCAEGVVGVEVFERLGAAASAHDRGGDLGRYWVWVDFLTRKHLPGDVSFPDELDRWASRLEQEPAEGRQAERRRLPHYERLARVLAFVKSNADLPEREVARQTEVPASTFRQWPEYLALRKMLAGKPASGHKTHDGTVEAYD